LQVGRPDCPAKESCAIVAPMTVLNQKIIRLFEDTSVENLVRAGAAP
jgi:hypothetical protein